MKLKTFILLLFLVFCQNTLASDLFTKISASGLELPDSATEWDCVRHNITGQIWEKKTPDNKGDEFTYAEAVEYKDQVNAPVNAPVNEKALCGYKDWRIPTLKELNSIVDRTTYRPSINSDYFPNVDFFSNYYWSSTSYAGIKENYWYVDFVTGEFSVPTSNWEYNVRLVRGEPYFDAFDYSKLDAQGNLLPDTAMEWSCVLDNHSGLIWEVKTPANKDALFIREEAFNYARQVNDTGLCGFKDWRVPEIDELITLFDYTIYHQPIKTDFFPNSNISPFYWSATPYLFEGSHLIAGGTHWLAEFYDGQPVWLTDSENHIRLVRSGQYFAFLNADKSNLSRPTWRWQATTASALAYRYKLDDNDFSQGATETTATSYTPERDLSDGKHTLYMQMQYNDNGTERWSVSKASDITVDTVAPYTTYKIYTEENSNSVEFEVDFTCNDALTGCEFFVNGKPWSVTDRFKLDALSVSYYGVDGAGNVEREKTINRTEIGKLRIFGTILEAQNGIDDVTITFVGENEEVYGTPTTDINGEYLGRLDLGWTGLVTPSKQGYTFEPINKLVNDLQTDTSINFEATAVESEEQARAIIIAGGGDLDDPLWTATNTSANFAYRALLYKGLSKDNIRYYNIDTEQDVDNDGANNDILSAPSSALLQQSINDWAQGYVTDKKPLIIYLLDHGLPDQFFISKPAVGAADSLDSATLDSWLDELQAQTNTKVILIYDACFSGSFMKNLTATGDQKRILIFSAGKDELAYFGSRGDMSFSNFFWSHTLKGESIRDSFLNSRRAIRNATNQVQQSIMDDNNDGIWDSHQDGALSALTYLGNPLVSAAALPVITDSTPQQSVNPGSSLNAYAKVDIEASRVWAVLIPPQEGDNDDQPVTDLPEFPMVMNPASGHYEASINGFNQAGVYQLSFYAQANDEAGFISLPKTVKIAAFPSQGQVSIEQIEALFDWAETSFPDLFSPANQVTKELAGYIYRYYEQPQTYLAVKDNRVYLFNPVLGLLDVGGLPAILGLMP